MSVLSIQIQGEKLAGWMTGKGGGYGLFLHLLSDIHVFVYKDLMRKVPVFIFIIPVTLY